MLKEDMPLSSFQLQGAVLNPKKRLRTGQQLRTCRITYQLSEKTSLQMT